MKKRISIIILGMFIIILLLPTFLQKEAIPDSLEVMGAAWGMDLIKLCKENGIPYTHNISIRLVRDGVVIVLFLAIVWITTPADDKKKIEEKKK